jgi:hypothetical protein
MEIQALFLEIHNFRGPVIMTLQKDNVAITGMMKKDKLMGFTMIVGEYLIDYVSYYPYDINEQDFFDIIAISTNKKISI